MVIGIVTPRPIQWGQGEADIILTHYYYITLQFTLHVLADCKHNIVMVFADDPAKLVLDDGELEPVALSNDRLNPGGPRQPFVLQSSS